MGVYMHQIAYNKLPVSVSHGELERIGENKRVSRKIKDEYKKDKKNAKIMWLVIYKYHC